MKHLILLVAVSFFWINVSVADIQCSVEGTGTGSERRPVDCPQCEIWKDRREKAEKACENAFGVGVSMCITKISECHACVEEGGECKVEEDEDDEGKYKKFAETCRPGELTKELKDLNIDDNLEEQAKVRDKKEEKFLKLEAELGKEEATLQEKISEKRKAITTHINGVNQAMEEANKAAGQRLTTLNNEILQIRRAVEELNFQKVKLEAERVKQIQDVNDSCKKEAYARIRNEINKKRASFYKGSWRPSSFSRFTRNMHMSSKNRRFRRMEIHYNSCKKRKEEVYKKVRETFSLALAGLNKKIKTADEDMRSKVNEKSQIPIDKQLKDIIKEGESTRLLIQEDHDARLAGIAKQIEQKRKELTVTQHALTNASYELGYWKELNTIATDWRLKRGDSTEGSMDARGAIIQLYQADSSENVDKCGDTSPFKGGGSKFLEDTNNENYSEALKNVREYIRKGKGRVRQ